MFNRTLSALAAVALTGATLAAGTSASAQGIEDSVKVRYGDLDLSSTSGAARFERRLRNAAKEVCGEETRDLLINEAVHACQARAMANARSDLQVAIATKAGSRTVALRTD
jgi:UrcA family protein